MLTMKSVETIDIIDFNKVISNNMKIKVYFQKMSISQNKNKFN